MLLILQLLQVIRQLAELLPHLALRLLLPRCLLGLLQQAVSAVLQLQAALLETCRLVLQLLQLTLCNMSITKSYIQNGFSIK